MANWQAGDHAEIVDSPQQSRHLRGSRGKIVSAERHSVVFRADDADKNIVLELRYFELRQLDLA